MDACATPTGASTYTESSRGTGTMTITSTDATTCLRTYKLTQVSGATKTITEVADEPIVRTGSTMLDGVFALAVQEAKQNSVDTISNGSYNSGNATSCVIDSVGCYQTGANWTYVWTRDTAYAAALGLSSLDPLRVRNSLLFKLSDRRTGWYSDTSDLQVIQDSGSGGSYPISTDRVSWAIAAQDVIDWLPDEYRQSFKDTTYTALRNTIEHDRAVVYDATNHLYSGESSYLDWRWQTYPSWIGKDMTQIAQSMALSTNVVHWVAISQVATLAAQAGDTTAAATYQGWADDLAESIRTHYWLPERGQFSAMVTGTLDPSPTLRFDALATALVVLTGIATDEQAAQAIANFPQASTGPTAIWPQQSSIWDNRSKLSYHNYSSWPFLTAFMMRAAAQVGNDTSATRQLDALVRVPALFGSNYENVNILTGGLDTDTNSTRQLWSIAGALSAFQQSIFGIDPDEDGLVVNPFVTAQERTQWFGDTDSIALQHLTYRGRTVNVQVNLPADTATAGAYAVTGLTVNGTAVPVGSSIAPAQLGAQGSTATIVVTLGAALDSVSAADEIDTANVASITGPDVPAITSVTGVGADTIKVGIDLNGANASDVSMDVLRDGVVIASDVPASALYTDSAATGMAYHSYCYSVRLTAHATGNTSQPAKASCYWGPNSDRLLTVDSSNFTDIVGGEWGDKTIDGTTHRYVKNWGNGLTDSQTATITATRTGTYLAQVDYAVNTNNIPDGVSSGIKLLTIKDNATGEVIASKPVTLSNTGDWNLINKSTFVSADLIGGRTYELILASDKLAVNMGYFQTNAVYKQGNEDLTSGPRNYNDIYAMRLLLKDVDEFAVTARDDASLALGDTLAGTLATVAGGLATTAAGLTTTVDWGDGTAQTPVVTAVGDGTFTISGSHTYATAGTRTVKVTVSDGTTTLTDEFTAVVTVPTLTSSVPAITGTLQAGKTLTAVPGGWSAGAALTYQWFANGTAIAGATAATLTLTAAHVGARISVAVTGTAAGFEPLTRTSSQTAAVVAASDPAVTTPTTPTLKKLTATSVKLKGKAKVGKKLKAKVVAGGPSPVKVTYTWYVGSKRIKKATGASLKLRKSYRGKKITVKVTTSKSGYASTTVKARSKKVRK